MATKRVIVVGGGAAGFFAAITCAEAAPDAEVIVLEKGPRFLSKVRISGGGRCNVTHHCFDPRELAARFPRGGQELIGPFQRFQPRDTVEWFEARGVKLKTEKDGRMFPITDSSETIIDCLTRAARAAKVKLVENCGVATVDNASSPSLGDGRSADERFLVKTTKGEELPCDKLLLATGGCRTASLGALAESLGHVLQPPVPSLFTFHIEVPWLRSLSGVSVEQAEAAVPDARLRERGAILVTHWGLSGPVVLRLSAWGARKLCEMDYRFRLQVNWLPALTVEQIAAELESRRKSQPNRLIVNSPIPSLTARLWEQLVLTAGIARETRWAALSRLHARQLVQQLTQSEFPVSGKSLNKDEFVTCGGVRLKEVNFRTMESRICPGLYFAGELLDIDGITGGFNFQAAWTTGWIAGNAMAEAI
jgi:predicted Rossmann fold flavoprotein